MITKVRILGFDHQVVESPSPFPSGDGTVLQGQIDHHGQVIRVYGGDDITDAARRRILMHEVIHGIDSAMDTNLTESDVIRLSNGIDAVLADNPELRGLYDVSLE